MFRFVLFPDRIAACSNHHPCSLAVDAKRAVEGDILTLENAYFRIDGIGVKFDWL
jgi:hypothetical protein